MMAAAGLGIAFNAKPMVQELADIAINATRLDAILERETPSLAVRPGVLDACDPRAHLP